MLTLAFPPSMAREKKRCQPISPPISALPNTKMLAQLCALLRCSCHKNYHIFKSLTPPPTIYHSLPSSLGQKYGRVWLSYLSALCLIRPKARCQPDCHVFWNSENESTFQPFRPLAALCSMWLQNFWVLVVGWESFSASRGHPQPLA